MVMRIRVFSSPIASLISSSSSSSPSYLSPTFNLPFRTFSNSIRQNPKLPSTSHVSATKATKPSVSGTVKFIKSALFIPPGVGADEVQEDMILPGSNIVLGPYSGNSPIKQVEFVKSSGRPNDCPKDERPVFAILGGSNVGKSSLINALVRKKEIVLTFKKLGFL